MRYRWFAACLAMGVIALSSSMPSTDAQAPAGRGQGGARGGRRGAQPATPSKPTPRWPDGRVNLSQAPGVKGFWNVMTGTLIAPAGLPGNLTVEEIPFQ